MTFCHLLMFFKINFFENSFRNTIRLSNSLKPDQARCYVGPDLGLNCLQRLSVGDTYKHRVSYMNAHVLLDLLNELRKRDEMGGLPSILSLFSNEFN